MQTAMKLIGRSQTSSVDYKTRRDVVLPGKASIDFILDAPCRIININGRISMSAADLPGDTGGTFTWSTASKKIRLINGLGPRLVIEALGKPSSSRDSETVTVTRTDRQGKQAVKTVKLTVALVRFLPAKNQKYGYDDFDTAQNGLDDHICVKSEDFTYATIQIDGGALPYDFDFAFDKSDICTAEALNASAKFDLKISAGRFEKSATVLQVRSRCRSSEIFAAITVHVYTEKMVSVLIAKVSDSSSPETRLNYPDADYASFENIANEKLKEAVARYELANFKNSNSVLNVNFDENHDGFVTFDINANGGKEFEAIKKAVQSDQEADCTVVIIRRLRSLYFLKSQAKAGSRTIEVVGSNIFLGSMQLGSGANLESVNVIRQEHGTGYLEAPLMYHHNANDWLEFRAAAWSTNPILISEGNVPLEETKWTILHEVGHSALKLKDVIDRNDFMNFSQGNSDMRLRFCPRVLAYVPNSTQNQWETIPRPRIKKSKKEKK